MTINPDKTSSHKFEGEIWRMEISSAAQRSTEDRAENPAAILFAEVRNVADKTVSFASIDLQTGELYFKDLVTDERWLTGIETGFDGVLLLHHYQSEASPVHRGIIAYDAKTSALLWSNYNYSFDHLSVNGPVVFDHRLQPRKLILSDVQTGGLLRPFDAATDLPLKNNVRLPEPVQASALDLPVAAYGNLADYLDHNNHRIVSLHALNEGRLQQRLYIMNGKNITFEDLLNNNIQKMQPESFMLFNNQLIYLVNRHEIKFLTL